MASSSNPPSTTTKPSTSTTSTAMPPSPEELHLANSTHLTRPEVLRRRIHNCNQLLKCYKAYYWAMMEELRVKYREFMWKYGESPFVEEEGEEGEGEEMGESGEGEGNFGGKVRCAFVGCKLKAMALTQFCHLHVLSDPKQMLYKPCSYVIKSSHAGPIQCNKPIVRSMTPSLCSLHLQKAQKHMTTALRKVGLNVSASTKFAPKFHVLVAEFVHQIQDKRRAAKKRVPSANKRILKEEES